MFLLVLGQLRIAGNRHRQLFIFKMEDRVRHQLRAGELHRILPFLIANGEVHDVDQFYRLLVFQVELLNLGVITLQPSNGDHVTPAKPLCRGYHT